jgi:hypothetical protein
MEIFGGNNFESIFGLLLWVVILMFLWYKSPITAVWFGVYLCWITIPICLVITAALSGMVYKN